MCSSTELAPEFEPRTQRDPCMQGKHPTPYYSATLNLSCLLSPSDHLRQFQMLRAILNSKCILHKCRSRRCIQRSLECSLPSDCLPTGKFWYSLGSYELCPASPWEYRGLFLKCSLLPGILLGLCPGPLARV